MAHGAVKHDYHILPPSPWPFVGSASATMMAIGLIAWIKGGVFGIEKGQWWLFALGISGVLYTFFPAVEDAAGSKQAAATPRIIEPLGGKPPRAL